jgi:hypothetical protein
MSEVTESDGVYVPLYTPTMWEEMMADVSEVTPKSDVQAAAELVKNQFSGVPMYMYAG